MRAVGEERRIGGSALADDSGADSSARFRALYKSTFSDIYAYATRALAPDQSEIDDVVAEVYLVAWRRIDELPQSPEDRLWLFGVARNVVRNTRRSTNRRLLLVHRIRRQPHPPDGSGEPSDLDVTAALRRLSPTSAKSCSSWSGTDFPLPRPPRCSGARSTSYRCACTVPANGSGAGYEQPAGTGTARRPAPFRPPRTPPFRWIRRTDNEH